MRLKKIPPTPLPEGGLRLKFDSWEAPFSKGGGAARRGFLLVKCQLSAFPAPQRELIMSFR